MVLISTEWFGSVYLFNIGDIFYGQLIWFVRIIKLTGMDQMILGIPDPLILAAYLLCFFGAVWCMIYGLRHWNDAD